MKKKDNYTIEPKRVIIFILFCLLFYFPVFHHLDRLPIALWDESLFSLRALYMHLTGDYLHNFNLFEGMPDHANTKLPFTTFFQVLTLKILGISELSIRLPIVLIFTATVFYMIYHFKKRFNSVWAGYVFGLVAITSIGFVAPHVLRTGDQDAPFACYMVLATIGFIRYLETREAKPLIGFTVFALAAVLTKNLLAGLLAPGILVFALFTRQLIPILKDYKFWIAALIIVGGYSGVIFYYETQFPGFFDRMWNYELMGRYTNAIENHDKPPFFYVKYLAFEKFMPYFFILPFVFATAFTEKIDQKLKHSILCFSSVSFFYLLILSFSKTQTTWYIAPIYLFGTYLIALGAIPTYEYVITKSKQYKKVFMIGLFFIWALLYAVVVSKNMSIQPEKDAKYGWFMKKIEKENPDLKKYTLVDNNFGTSAGFYKEMYNQKGYDITYQRGIHYYDNQVIMTCLNNVLNPTGEKYNYEVLREWDDCKLLKIQSKK